MTRPSCRSAGPHPLGVGVRLGAAQPPLRAKGHLNAQPRAPNRCSIHTTLKLGPWPWVRGERSAIICRTVMGGWVCCMGRHTCAQIRAPPPEPGPSEVADQGAVYSHKSTGEKTHRQRSGGPEPSPGRYVWRGWGGTPRRGPQTQGTRHCLRDNWPTKKTPPLRSHWKVRT